MYTCIAALIAYVKGRYYHLFYFPSPLLWLLALVCEAPMIASLWACRCNLVALISAFVRLGTKTLLQLLSHNSNLLWLIVLPVFQESLPSDGGCDWTGMHTMLLTVPLHTETPDLPQYPLRCSLSNGTAPLPPNAHTYVQPPAVYKVVISGGHTVSTLDRQATVQWELLS